MFTCCWFLQHNFVVVDLHIYSETTDKILDETVVTRLRTKFYSKGVVLFYQIQHLRAYLRTGVFGPHEIKVFIS